MSQNVLIRRLRPQLFTRYHILACSFPQRSFTCAAPQRQERDVTQDYKKRVAHLNDHTHEKEWYPRLQSSSEARWPIRKYREELQFLDKDETLDDGDTFTIAGRVQSVRTAGSKLIFLDLEQDGHTLQAVCAKRYIDEAEGETLTTYKLFTKVVRKGDWYEVTGYGHRTAAGELSIRATRLPKLLSPCLHQIPDELNDDETRATARHVDMLVPGSEAIKTIRTRHLVEQHLNSFLANDGFVKVNTPILTAGAGGAIARPFETEATELEGQTLNLRIAPELWLKRLIVGGLNKVYEIGPAFRNEGVDATHNPEFYTCEFYEAFATLDDLMTKTENLLWTMARPVAVPTAIPSPPFATSMEDLNFTAPFARLEFIPTIEAALNTSLLDLASPTATDDLLALFSTHGLATPANPTLPRLLDALAAKFIEPHCHQPTFITHHPACLSPLAKHFTCPTTSQRISARAELFIAGTEFANMYEEENSPFEQRRKFEDQLQYRTVDGEGDARQAVDEDYLRCLEWGLPPTGGWGCGVERLVMLFAGRGRIGDVLPFGNLRHVVGRGGGRGGRREGMGAVGKGEGE